MRMCNCAPIIKQNQSMIAIILQKSRTVYHHECPQRGGGGGAKVSDCSPLNLLHVGTIFPLTGDLFELAPLTKISAGVHANHSYL